eukprot:GHVQ01020387.1.p1 GENE.GHVQ01020387.1~~GHVQ01020387.1.p1  ORF type:complete len:288 (-),score=61.43 GHVQ01020387.1:445-1245(-)
MVETLDNDIVQGTGREEGIRALSVNAVVLEAAREVLPGDIDIPPMDVNLVDLGIDSLGAVNFRNEIQEKLGVTLSVSSIAENPTLYGIIDFIHSQQQQQQKEQQEHQSSINQSVVAIAAAQDGHRLTNTTRQQGDPRSHHSDVGNPSLSLEKHVYTDGDGETGTTQRCGGGMRYLPDIPEGSAMYQGVRLFATLLGLVDRLRRMAPWRGGGGGVHVEQEGGRGGARGKGERVETHGMDGESTDGIDTLFQVLVMMFCLVGFLAHNV